LNEQGELVARMTDTAIERVRQQHHVSVRQMAVDADGDPTSDLRAAFPHIRFLDADGGDDLPIVYELPNSGVEQLLSLDSTTARALLAALERVPKAAIGAVRSVGVAQFEANTGIVGIAFGGSLLVSAELMTEERELAETVVHEATHNLQFLLDGELGTWLWNPEAWPADVRAAAEKTISKHRFEAGITRAWADLHETWSTTTRATPGKT
jgi:hypothetical protein